MPNEAPVVAEWRSCERCGTQLALSLLSCPSCQRLVHGPELERLAAAARLAENAGNLRQSIGEWEAALALLPPGTKQHETIGRRLMALRAKVDGHAADAPKSHPGLTAGLAGAGTLALLLWKFKFVLVFLLTKAKFLLFGLTKMSTLLSMFAYFGVAWARWGWIFAAGIVVSIYIHEMGHVWALKRHGIPASAPMFIPGIGALVLLKQHPPDEKIDAEVGLAGPLWGLGAAVVALLLFWVTHNQLWSAIAWWGAWVNVFNLLPVWQLDGGRGFNAMSRAHRWAAVGVLTIGWLIAQQGLFFLLVAVAVARAFAAPASKPDPRALVRYASLVVAFALLLRLPQAA